MNPIQKYLIIMLGIVLQGQMCADAGEFFYDGQNPREGYHYTPDDLFHAHANLNSIPPNYILTSADPNANPSIARMALITQDPENGEWVVQYYTIESLPRKSLPTLQEAQRYTLAHLESGTSQQPPQEQFIPSAGIPQKVKFPKESPRAWRRAHLR